MGSFSDYSSPKTSYESSFSVPRSPKSSSYESSKVSDTSITRLMGSEESDVNLDSSILSSKSELNSISELITSYLSINEQIETATTLLAELQHQKVILEQKIANTPGFSKLATMFDSINNSKGPKR